MMMVATALALLGFALLGHASRAPLYRRGARAVGWVSLLAAFPAAIFAAGWVVGPILWVALMMLGAGVAFVALNCLPRQRGRRSVEGRGD